MRIEHKQTLLLPRGGRKIVTKIHLVKVQQIQVQEQGINKENMASTKK